MRKVTRLLPVLLVLAACAPPAPPAPPAAPSPPVQAEPEPAPATTDASVATDRPPAGSYGFNWLDPENSTCKKLTDEDIASFKQCTASKNAFGLEVDSLGCPVDAKVEMIVYSTEAQCQQGFETMQSNGD